mgnify:CR=1 FL=1
MNVDMRKFVIDWETGKVKYIDHGIDEYYRKDMPFIDDRFDKDVTPDNEESDNE